MVFVNYEKALIALEKKKFGTVGETRNFSWSVDGSGKYDDEIIKLGTVIMVCDQIGRQARKFIITSIV
jgi:hypothetical protein